MSGGTNTSTTSNGPPQQFLDAFSAVNSRAQDVAGTPYQNYPGQVVAGLSPDQIGGLSSIENLTANGGVQAPYLHAAADALDSSRAQLINPQTAGWIEAGASGLSPDNIAQFTNPWTNDVVDATQAQFNNQNAQASQRLAGDAASRGAYGGDREAVAQGIAAGQQQLAQAPVIADLRSKGFLTALDAAGKQGALRSNAAQQYIDAAKAQGSLQAQAGQGYAGLGREALSLGLQGAGSQLQAGALEQQQAQQSLNVPYQQWIAALGYPFQTAGWLANIAEGLGGASGGNSRTTTPGPSAASQVGGLATGAVGLAGATGAFGNNGWLTGSGGGGSFNYGLYGARDGGAIKGHDLTDKDALVRRAAGGGTPDSFGVDSRPRIPLSEFNQFMQPSGTNVHRAMGGDIPDISLSVIPGADGLGAAPSKPGTMDILKDYGSTSKTDGGDSTIGSILKTAGQAAASIWGGPAGAAAGAAFNNAVHFADGGDVETKTPWYQPLIEQYLSDQMAQSLGLSDGMSHGGMVPRFAMGGETLSDWQRSEEGGRHGLLASPVAGRTDHLAISPESGSYVIPADVISGLGEGNTLAGANVMQRILETGPHGLRQAAGNRSAKGFPSPPPAYREGSGMASGGEIPHRAAGGLNPAVSDYLGASGGMTPANTIVTGIPALDAYLGTTKAGAWYAPPIVYKPPPPVAPTVPAEPETPVSSADPVLRPFDGGGGEKRGGLVKAREAGGLIPRYDDGGDVEADPVQIDIAQPYTQEQLASGLIDPTPLIEPTPLMPEQTESGLLFPRNTRGTQKLGLTRSRTTTSEELPTDPESSGAPPGTPPGMQPASSDDSGGSDADTDKPGTKRFRAAAPDPWLALAQAGFSAAAGKSPHALENIGAGAAKGVETYIAQKQKADAANLQADIWGGRLGVQDKRADTYAERVRDQRAIAERKAQLIAGGMEETAAHHRAAEEVARDRARNYGDRTDMLDRQGNRKGDQADRRLNQGDQRITDAKTNAERTYQLNVQKAQSTEDYRQSQRDLAGMKLTDSQVKRIDANTRALVGATGMNWKKAQDQVLATEGVVQKRITPTSVPSGRSAPSSGAPPPVADFFK